MRQKGKESLDCVSQFYNVQLQPEQQVRVNLDEETQDGVSPLDDIDGLSGTDNAKEDCVFSPSDDG